MAHHEGVSERTLEVALSITLGIILMTVTSLITKSTLWVGFSGLFCISSFVQGRILNRSFVVQIPFLLVCAIKEPILGTLFLVTYSIQSVLASRVNAQRFTVLLASEVITYSVFCLLLKRIAPELWLFAGFAYVSLRTLCSSLIANKTGKPLDIGAISGTWAFVSTQAYVSLAMALFYFERTEVTQVFVVSMSIVNAVWIGILFTYQKAHQEYGKGVVALGGLLNYSHVYTGNHSRRVAYLARETGRRLRIAEWKLDYLVQAALLHDIGKIAVSEQILEKPGKLTDQEFDEIKKHPVTGQKIVANLSELKIVSEWIRHHHERVDGRGYPDKLERRKIPVESHVISVIDAYDAMTGHSGDGHKRLYRDPISSEDAIAELKRCSGTQFDARIVKHFIRVIEERKGKLL